jgi:hypothetical protein
MPGLNPESAFREMAKMDFDTSLSDASGLNDKFQRAMSLLHWQMCVWRKRNNRPKKSQRGAPSRKSSG